MVPLFLQWFSHFLWPLKTTICSLYPFQASKIFTKQMIHSPEFQSKNLDVVIFIVLVYYPLQSKAN